MCQPRPRATSTERPRTRPIQRRRTLPRPPLPGRFASSLSSWALGEAEPDGWRPPEVEPAEKDDRCEEGRSEAAEGVVVMAGARAEGSG